MLGVMFSVASQDTDAEAVMAFGMQHIIQVFSRLIWLTIPRYSTSTVCFTMSMFPVVLSLHFLHISLREMLMLLISMHLEICGVFVQLCARAVARRWPEQLCDVGSCSCVTSVRAVV